MKKSLLFILLLCGINLFSQNHYWVLFTDKKGVSFDPYEYFDQKAIDRRLKNGLNLYDSTDFPVKQEYIDNISLLVDSVNVVTRWFNGVSVIADDEQIKKVAKLGFVREIQPIYLTTRIADYSTSMSEFDTMLLQNEMRMFQADYFEQKGINGQGVRIAVFDAGFPGVDKIPVFEHLRNNNKIIKTYDFAKKKEFVYSYNHHGTMVLSCIAGINGDLKMGLATGAEFLLARTEINTEPFSEEENWLAAAEWADKNGADIISSSLGYTLPRYFQYEMDGKTTFVAKAATMAFNKGILVVNAMGNDGDDKWFVVGTPADAEAVLSIGGVDPFTNLHISFSSFGPTADGRLKPNVCAAGQALVASPKKITTAYGTSFATPLVSGFAACVLQLNPDFTAKQLKANIEQSGNLYPYFDYAHGYGIPQASYFTEKYKAKDTTFVIGLDTGFIFIELDTTAKMGTDSIYFYYHFRHKNGKIARYKVIKPKNNEIVISIPNELERPIIFMGHYRGYTNEIILKQ
jgi:hypothetical protein